MTKNHDPSFNITKELADQFGTLALKMLTDTELAAAWRVNFLANFFTGPIYAELVDRFDLSRPGFVILFSLSQQDGLVARDVCLVTGLPKNSISRAVTELEARGLISRDTKDSDKRAKPLTLEPGGRKLLKEVLPLFHTRQSSLFAVLDEAEAAEFHRIMTKLVFAMPNWVNTEG
ncbi:MAG: MarR family transcriptional regulator [Pseudomonadota bacterium]